MWTGSHISTTTMAKGRTSPYPLLVAPGLHLLRFFAALCRSVPLQVLYLQWTQYLAKNWQSGGREFDPHQLHHKSFATNHIQAAHFSTLKLAVFGCVWVAFLRWKVSIVSPGIPKCIGSLDDESER
jgi:hypothetical protein